MQESFENKFTTFAEFAIDVATHRNSTDYQQFFDNEGYLIFDDLITAYGLTPVIGKFITLKDQSFLGAEASLNFSRMKMGTQYAIQFNGGKFDNIIS